MSRQQKTKLTAKHSFFLKLAALVGLGMLAFPSVASASPPKLATLPQTQWLNDGTYLYGESQQKDKLGKDYVVFQVKGKEIIGAIYRPASEFNCFRGQVNSRQINLSIIDPATQINYPLAIKINNQSPLASLNQAKIKQSLVGYHQITNINSSDRNLLELCLKNLLPQPI